MRPTLLKARRYDNRRWVPGRLGSQVQCGQMPIRDRLPRAIGYFPTACVDNAAPQRRYNALGLYTSGIGECSLRECNGGLDVCAQFLCTCGAPKGGSYVLRKQVHGFASSLCGSEYPVSILFRAVIAGAKIQYIPRKAYITRNVTAFV